MKYPEKVFASSLGICCTERIRAMQIAVSKHRMFVQRAAWARIYKERIDG